LELVVDNEDRYFLDNSWVQMLWLELDVDNVDHWLLDNNLVVLLLSVV
jgi:hypothetical protein